MFEHYREILRRIGDNNDDRIRYLVIEHVCNIPRISPVKMARNLLLDGYKILYDDSSISKIENNRKKMMVERWDKKED